MSVSSTAKVILSSIRKIYIPIIVLLVLCIPSLGFTQYAFADTSSNLDNIQSTGNYVGSHEVFMSINLPDDSEYLIKTIVYMSDSNYNGFMNLVLQPVDFNTFLGYMKLLKDDLLSTLQGFYVRLNINESINEYNIPSYEDNYELVYLPVSLFANDTYVNSCRFWIYSGTNYYSFLITNIYNFAYSDFSNYKYYGSYTDVKNTYGDDAYYSYILQTMKYTINSAPLKLSEFNNSSNSLSIMSYTADGFSNLNTEEFKLFKKTLKDVFTDSLTSTNDKLDDILNTGSGSFDDLEQDIGNASDKAEQGNQEIQDNAPKPDIDNTHDDTTDIIDSVLTEHGDNVSNILSAILGSNIINGMLLISISVGAIKYIFFGKG